MNQYLSCSDIYIVLQYIDGLGRHKVVKSRSLAKRRIQHPSISFAVSQQTTFVDTPPQRSLIDAATPTEQVSAFCRAIFCKVIPHEMWGVGKEGEHNLRTLLHHVHSFVQLRRFEGLTMHNVSQGFKVRLYRVLRLA